MKNWQFITILSLIIVCFVCLWYKIDKIDKIEKDSYRNYSEIMANASDLVNLKEDFRQVLEVIWDMKYSVWIIETNVLAIDDGVASIENKLWIQ